MYCWVGNCLSLVNLCDSNYVFIVRSRTHWSWLEVVVLDSKFVRYNIWTAESIMNHAKVNKNGTCQAWTSVFWWIYGVFSTKFEGCSIDNLKMNPRMILIIKRYAISFCVLEFVLVRSEIMNSVYITNFCDLVEDHQRVLFLPAVSCTTRLPLLRTDAEWSPASTIRADMLFLQFALSRERTPFSEVFARDLRSSSSPIVWVAAAQRRDHEPGESIQLMPHRCFVQSAEGDHRYFVLWISSSYPSSSLTNIIAWPWP